MASTRRKITTSTYEVQYRDGFRSSNREGGAPSFPTPLAAWVATANVQVRGSADVDGGAWNLIVRACVHNTRCIGSSPARSIMKTLCILMIPGSGLELHQQTGSARPRRPDILLFRRRLAVAEIISSVSLLRPTTIHQIHTPYVSRTLTFAKKKERPRTARDLGDDGTGTGAHHDHKISRS